MSYFEGKVALVTGASRGVGFAVARELCAQGASVVISAREQERLTKSERELREMGGRVIGCAGDVGNWDDASRMVNTAVENFGRLDIIVNNAGVSMRGDFQRLSPDVCGQVIQTNLMGSIYVSRAGVNHLVEAQGHLIFISSIAGIFGLPAASIYCASKKALSGLAESLRIELAPHVHVGVVYLGYTEHDPEKRILLGDGSKGLPDRPAHHTQKQAASIILRMIKQRKRWIVMTPVGILGWTFYRIAPSLLEKMVIMAKTNQWGIYKKFS